MALHAGSAERWASCMGKEEKIRAGFFRLRKYKIKFNFKSWKGLASP
jgi:hypothetical protein